MNYYVHDIDPVLIELGVVKIRWYGLMYLTGFLTAYFHFKWRFKQGWLRLSPIEVQDLFTYLMVGMMLGARIFYAFVYNWDSYKHNLIEILYIWQGGLSFHGAALGFVVAIILFGRKKGYGFWHIADHVCMGAALGVFFGRWGNFTNGELWGRPTDVPWAVIFPKADQLPRHPSQLYQALGEGLIVFLILLWVDRRERKKHMTIKVNKKGIKEVHWQRTGIVAATYVLLYGIARFVVEFFREPDRQLGFYFRYFSMGQILCFIMILTSFVLYRQVLRNPAEEKYKV